jgi:hypothetical protein
MAQSSLYYLRFHVRPRDDRHGAYSGAFVNCWIDRPDMEAAQAAARVLIEEFGWVAVSVEDSAIVDGSHYQNASDGLRYYKQALTDKEVLVFHTYPTGEGPDAD